MKHRYRTHHRHALASAWILAGLIAVTAIGDPRIVTAQQTSSPDVCEVAESFAAADRATIKVAKASREEQLAAQETWHQALASDEPWTEGQERAYSVLAGDLEQRCNIELPR